MTRVTFDVMGHPVAQGSKKAFVVGGKARMVEMGKGHGNWRNQVSEAAAVAGLAQGVAGLEGPLRLFIVFRFPMPKSRPKRLRDLGIAWKTSAPDLSKLARSVEDSLTTSGLIVDDRYICRLDLQKIEVTDWLGCSILVETLEEWQKG